MGQLKRLLGQYRRVIDIPLKDFRARGYSVLVVDLDNTLLTSEDETVGPKETQWLAQALIEGWKVAIVSNGSENHVHVRVAHLGVHCVVSKARKPWPRSFIRIATGFGAAPACMLVVGDQFLTDALGGLLSGAGVILVEPLSKREHPFPAAFRWLDLILRRLFLS